MAQMIDSKFDPETQIIFSHEELLAAISPNTPFKRGQVVIIDEAQWVMGSRHWFTSIQQDVMDHMESVRSRGLIIFIVSLNIDLLDKIIREFMLSHMTYQTDRGKFVVYRMSKPRFGGDVHYKRLGSVKVRLPDALKCSFMSCLMCYAREYCMTVRARYERKKYSFIQAKSDEAITKRRDKTKTVEKFDRTALVQILKAGVFSGKIKITKQKTLDFFDSQYVLEEVAPNLTTLEIKKLLNRVRHELPQLNEAQTTAPTEQTSV
jgi:hypothetical protein